MIPAPRMELHASGQGGEAPALSDEQLFAGLKRNPKYFDLIMRRYWDRLLNFAFRFLGDRDAAEDIVEETFFRVLRKSRERMVLTNFSTWVFTIAANLAKSELRRRHTWRFLSLDRDKEEGDSAGYAMELPDEAHRPDTIAENRMLNVRIQEAIEELPAKYREAVVLRDVEGFSYEEIAEVTDVPIGTVKSRVNRGRLRLQKRLRDAGDGLDTEIYEKEESSL